jgi:uncharacterized phiE125 gp8 family phage protein
MQWTLETLVPPASEPVTLAEAKNHLRVDGNDDDALITRLIGAARRWCESFQGRAWVTRTYRLRLERFPKGPIVLPFPPLQAVSAIRYTRADGIEITIPSASYSALTGEPASVVPLQAWPTEALAPGLPVSVEFVAGYGDAAAVPEDAKAALLLILGGLYENREDETVAREVPHALSMGARALLWPERRLYEGPGD